MKDTAIKYKLYSSYVDNKLFLLLKLVAHNIYKIRLISYAVI